MNTCFCGNPIGEDGILCARCAALRVLELDSYATEKQIKASYRLLVKVWHPDRFQNDATLKWEAEAKLKKVNAAYSVLNSTFGNPKRSAKRARAEATSQGVPGTPTSIAAPRKPERSLRDLGRVHPLIEHAHASGGAAGGPATSL